MPQAAWPKHKLEFQRRACRLLPALLSLCVLARSQHFNEAFSVATGVGKDVSPVSHVDRALLQAGTMPEPAPSPVPTSGAPRQPPPPPPPAASPAPLADVTVVTTPEELQAAVAAAVVDIEIRAHLDLSNLTRPRNPEIPGASTEDAPRNLALLYRIQEMRSMRGNCSDPDAATTLGLAQEEAATLLPLKPRQCLVIVPDTFLMSNGGSYWLDNLYLKLRRHRAVSRFSFVTAGELTENIGFDEVSDSDLYLTNLTLQGEYRGSFRGVKLEAPNSNMLLQDCIFTDWSGYFSPVSSLFSGLVNIVDTVFRNMRLPVELVDVSDGGVVRFSNVALANVSLAHGNIVSTTGNDYIPVPTFAVTMYAADDENYDVDYTLVPLADRGMFGAEFFIDEAVMSDCVYVRVPEGELLPGCPPATVQARQLVIRRGSEDDTLGRQRYSDYLLGDAQDRLAEDLLKPDAPWLVAARGALGPLPPAPGWPPFNVTPTAEPVARSSLMMPLPVPEGDLVPEFERSPALARSADRAAAVTAASYTGLKGGDDGVATGVIVLLAVGGLLALFALAAGVWASRSLRPPQQPGDSKGGLLLQPRRPRLPAWMSVGDTTTSDATGVTPIISDEGSLLRHTGSAVSGGMQNSASMPQSAMNSQYEYALPTQVAMLMGGPILETEVEEDPAAADAGKRGGGVSHKKRGETSGASTTGDGDMLRMLQLPVLAATQPSGVPSDRGLSLTDGSAGSGGGGSLPGSNTAPLAGVPSAACGREQSLRVRTEKPGSTVVMAPYDDTYMHAMRTMRASGSVASRTMHTMDVTIGSTSTSGEGWRTTGTPPAPPQQQQGGEVFGIRMLRTEGVEGEAERLEDAAVRAPAADVVEQAAEDGGGGSRIRRLQRLLDAFGDDDVFLGRFEMLGRQQRRRGGQAIVQFAEGVSDRCEYAIKFFLDYEAFLVEAALYAACFPYIRNEVSDEVIERADRVAQSADGGQAAPMSDVTARFLPQVESVCDGSAGGLEDPRGRWLPPCIVMEKGESLHDWSDRAEPDLFTSLAVLSNISKRLADMHEAGYVHRDLKPANVMWLPRANRWTVIDFGCVARIGEVAPLSFTLAYAAPEVAAAFSAGERFIESHIALDTWSLGVMAFELLTGAPAFNLLSDGRRGVLARLRGDRPLPWEGQLSPVVQRHLGTFKGPILQLLHREPSQRISMRKFHLTCSRLFSARTTVEA
eukprot:jgi/Ulvmu1/4266/UM194_0006.1